MGLGFVFIAPSSRIHVLELPSESELQGWHIRDQRPDDEELGLLKHVPGQLEKGGVSGSGHSAKPPD